MVDYILEKLWWKNISDITRLAKTIILAHNVQIIKIVLFCRLYLSESIAIHVQKIGMEHEEYGILDVVEK